MPQISLFLGKLEDASILKPFAVEPAFTYFQWNDPIGVTNKNGWVTQVRARMGPYQHIPSLTKISMQIKIEGWCNVFLHSHENMYRGIYYAIFNYNQLQTHKTVHNLTDLSRIYQHYYNILTKTLIWPTVISPKFSLSFWINTRTYSQNLLGYILTHINLILTIPLNHAHSRSKHLSFSVSPCVFLSLHCSVCLSPSLFLSL